MNGLKYLFILVFVIKIREPPTLHLFTANCNQYVRGVQIARNLVGNYITSLDMAGCSVTVLKADDELLRLWDAPVITPGLRWGA